MVRRLHWLSSAGDVPRQQFIDTINFVLGNPGENTRRELGPALSFEGIGLPSLVGRYAAESKVLTPEADALIKSSFAILL